jgi:putative transposase
MEKFQNKYRIPSARLQTWDYKSAAAYFVTICTQHRAHYFGEIENGKMRMNEIGQIAENEWLKTPSLRPDMNLQLGEFVVMPNHFHAIIIIGNNEYNTQMDGRDAMGGRDTMHRVSTAGNTSKNHFGPQSKNLASIVRGYKSSVTTQAKKLGYADFAWQSGFHEHIIRNQKSFDTVSDYVIHNPANWQNDEFWN